MAKKDLIINSDFDIKTKSYALIMSIAQDMQSATTKALKAYDLSKLQLDILHELEFTSRDGLTVKEIKEKMISDSPNVSRSINKLMENGFIEKERNLHDQRVVKIKITPSGQAIHIKADTAIFDTHTTTALTSEEFELLYLLLQKI